MRDLGLAKGDRCGLLSENRWEWAAADFAMMTPGVVSVPLYATLTAEQILYMLENSGARGVFVSTAAQREKIESIRSRLPELRTVICFDEGPLVSDDPPSGAKQREFEDAIAAVGPEDLASILYTSGTTGTPKGVMLTHANIVSNVLDSEPDIGPTDVALSFLPLAHIYERMVDYSYYFHGVTVAHVDSMENVPQALLKVRPTVAAAVPRFFEKIYGRLMDAVHAAPPLRQKLFHWALKAGFESIPYRLANRSLPLGLRLRLGVADRLVFSKLRERLGGRIRWFGSGSAPLARELAEFFYAVQVPVLEGYGLTETAPVVTASRLGR
ncbi:MAG: AMP-binding protein, partial [Acidobacteria bacterium]|nr:AMP-binding protein [Acidobacteriota bacterium]